LALVSFFSVYAEQHHCQPQQADLKKQTYSAYQGSACAITQ